MIDKLQLFVSAFKYAASADTAYGEYNPDQHGPLHNHCGCVAYAVQQLLGGKIRTGKVYGVKHYWNEVGLGEIDLSASQFGETDIRNKNCIFRRGSHYSDYCSPSYTPFLLGKSVVSTA